MEEACAPQVKQSVARHGDGDGALGDGARYAEGLADAVDLLEVKAAKECRADVPALNGPVVVGSAAGEELLRKPCCRRGCLGKAVF